MHALICWHLALGAGAALWLAQAAVAPGRLQTGPVPISDQ